MYNRTIRRTFARNSGSGLWSQRRTRCGLRSASLSHRWTVLLPIDRTKLHSMAARAKGRMAQCVRTPQSSARGLQAIDRTSCRSSGGKAGRPPRSPRIDETVQSIPRKPIAPQPDPAGCPPDGPGDRPRADPPRRQQHTPGAAGDPRPGAPRTTEVSKDAPLGGRHANARLGLGPSWCSASTMRF